MTCASFELGRITVATLDTGSDLLSEIERLVRENDIDFCEVSGIGTLDQAYLPPAIQKIELRRRPLNERSAA